MNGSLDDYITSFGLWCICWLHIDCILYSYSLFRLSGDWDLWLLHLIFVVGDWGRYFFTFLSGHIFAIMFPSSMAWDPELRFFGRAKHVNFVAFYRLILSPAPGWSFPELATSCAQAQAHKLEFQSWCQGTPRWLMTGLLYCFFKKLSCLFLFTLKNQCLILDVD